MELDLSKGVTCNTWTNFLRDYSHRVTHLLFDVELLHDSIAAFQALLATFGGPVCPRLHSLEVISDLVLDITNPTISVFLTSSVTSFTCGIVGDRSSEVLDFVARSGSPIQSLTVHVGPYYNSDHPETDPSLNFDFSRFELLRELHLSDIFPAGWRALSQCERLEVLTVSDSALTWESLEDEPVDSPLTFKALTDLRIHRSYKGDHFLRILCNTAMPSLCRASFEIAFQPSEEVAFLAHLGRSPLLEELDVRLGAGGSSLDVLQSLAGCQKLYTLTLSSAIPVSDASVEALAKAVTGIAQLSLDQYWHYAPSPFLSATFPKTERSLASLARYCPRLKTIEVSIKVTDMIDHPDASVDTFPWLETLIVHLHETPQGLEHRFVTFLAARCPRLRTLRICLDSLRVGSSFRVEREGELAREFFEKRGN